MSAPIHHLSWGSVSFIERPSSRVLMILTTLLLGSLLVAFILAFFIRVNVSVTANGHVDSISGETIATALVSGILLDLDVKEGETVHKDQLIARIRMEKSTEQAVQNLRNRADQRLAHVRAQTLKTLDRAEEKDLALPNELSAAVIESNKRVVSFSRSLTADRRAVDRELAPLKAQRKVLAQQLTMLRESNVKEYLRQQELSITEAQGHIEGQISSLEGASDAKLFNSKQDAERALENLISLCDKVIRAHQVLAPSSGLVAKLHVGTGSLIHEGSEVATLIPDQAPLVAEVKVASKDVRKVARGQTVLMTIDAFPSHRFGSFQGHVLTVESVKTSDGYVARLSIEQDPKAKEAAQFVPGMDVTARIITKRSTLMEIATDAVMGRFE